MITKTRALFAFLTFVTLNVLTYETYLICKSNDISPNTMTITRSGVKKEGCVDCLLNGVNEKIFFKLQGCGKKTLVFLHDIALNSNIWACQVKAFKNKYQILTIDLLGHGRSSKPTSGYSFEVFAQSIRCVLQELSISDPIFVGMGLGGAIAQFYVTHFPDEVCKLVLIGATPQLQASECWPFGLSPITIQTLIALLNSSPPKFAKAMARIYISEQQCKSEIKELRHTFEEITMQANAAAITAIGEFLISTTLIPSMESINVPTLVVAGGLDVASPVGASCALICGVKNSSMVLFVASGHLPNLTHVDQFNNVLRNFLKGRKNNSVIPDHDCDVCPCISSKTCPSCVVERPEQPKPMQKKPANR